MSPTIRIPLDASTCRRLRTAGTNGLAAATLEAVNETLSAPPAQTQRGAAPAPDVPVTPQAAEAVMSDAPAANTAPAAPMTATPAASGASGDAVGQALSAGTGVTIAHYYARLPGDANLNPYTRTHGGTGDG